MVFALVTLMSWDLRDFLIFLVMEGWSLVGEDVVKEGAVNLSCLLNCLRVDFFAFYLTIRSIFNRLRNEISL